MTIHSTAPVFCVEYLPKNNKRCITEMVSNNTKRSRLILSMVMLSIVTPLGVLLGLVLTLHSQTEAGAHVLLVGVLQGVAAGTLLYVTFFEVIRELFNKV